ncbi:MAG TPA: hypothetical protein VIL34_03625 [Actinopolymorphaceae bacterium]|jgi:hypothetical protein
MRKLLAAAGTAAILAVPTVFATPASAAVAPAQVTTDANVLNDVADILNNVLNRSVDHFLNNSLNDLVDVGDVVVIANLLSNL